MFINSLINTPQVRPLVVALLLSITASIINGLLHSIFIEPLPAGNILVYLCAMAFGPLYGIIAAAPNEISHALISGDILSVAKVSGILVLIGMLSKYYPHSPTFIVVILAAALFAPAYSLALSTQEILITSLTDLAFAMIAGACLLNDKVFYLIYGTKKLRTLPPLITFTVSIFGLLTMFTILMMIDPRFLIYDLPVHRLQLFLLLLAAIFALPAASASRFSNIIGGDTIGVRGINNQRIESGKTTTPFLDTH